MTTNWGDITTNWGDITTNWGDITTNNLTMLLFKGILNYLYL